MKKSSKRKTKPAIISAQTLLPTPPVALVLDGMISTLEGLAENFDRPIAVQVKRLIKLTTALRDEAARPRDGTRGSSRRKKVK